MLSMPPDVKRPLTAFGMMDFDPDGISILLQYRYGSPGLAHNAATARVPNLRWLGCFSDDILGIPESKQNQSMIHFSMRDFQRASVMLSWPFMSENYSESCWRRELQIMLMLQWRFEIELLENICEQLSKCL